MRHCELFCQVSEGHECCKLCDAHPSVVATAALAPQASEASVCAVRQHFAVVSPSWLQSSHKKSLCTIVLRAPLEAL